MLAQKMKGQKRQKATKGERPVDLLHVQHKRAV